MTTAETIAAIVGPFYIIVAFGLFLNPGAYRRITEDFCAQPALTYLGGIMALLMGLGVLAFHPVWTADWTVVITLIGWLVTAKGATLLIRPDAVLRLSQSMMRSDAQVRVMALAALLLGLYLAGRGFAIF